MILTALELLIYDPKLFKTRQEITLGNRMAPDGTVDEAWDTLFQAVDTLTAGGMSSDDSDVDESGRAIFLVKKRLWRNKGLTEFLKIID